MTLHLLIVFVAVFLLLFAAAASDAWSPSARPAAFENAPATRPRGLSFGLNPERTKCCVRDSSSNSVFCATDGTMSDRAKIKKFDVSGGKLALVGELVLDEMDALRVSVCSFMVQPISGVGASGNAYVGFTMDYMTNNPTKTVVFTVNTGTFALAPDKPVFEFQSCLLEAPATAAVATDNAIILATSASGLKRLNMNVPINNGPGATTTQGICTDVQLTQPGAAPTPAPSPAGNGGGSSTGYGSIFGGFIPQGAPNVNTSFWVTGTALFQYDARQNKVLANITAVNASLSQALFCDGPGGQVWVSVAVDKKLPGPKTYYRYLHKVQLLPSLQVVETANLGNTELVGFMAYDSAGAGTLYSAIRSPFLGVVNISASDLSGAQTTTDITGISDLDPTAVLPSGSKYYQQGSLPSVFCLFDRGSTSVVVFAVPTLTALPGQVQKKLPTLGLAVSFMPASLPAAKRTAHFAFRAGAEDVASAVVGDGNFFAVLASTPGLIVQIAADNLDEVLAEHQLDMLESISRADSVAAFDTDRSYLYVHGNTLTDSGEPAFVRRFDLRSGVLQLDDTLLFDNGRLDGVVVLKPKQNMLYCAGEATIPGVIYVQAINTNGPGGNMQTLSTIWIYGMGSKVKSARLDASGTRLLLATDTITLLQVDVYPVMTNATLEIITGGVADGATTLEVDPYGFVTIGYTTSSGDGQVSVVHQASKMELIAKTTVGATMGGGGFPSKKNVQMLRRTADDNIVGLSVTSSVNNGVTSTVTTAYTLQLDMISPRQGSQLMIGPLQNLPVLSQAMTFASADGFTFAMGRDRSATVIAILRSGSRTDTNQDAQLTALSKRSMLFFPRNAQAMTQAAAAALCASQGGRLPNFADTTEFDGVSLLFDQSPVWTAGTNVASMPGKPAVWDWGTSADEKPSPSRWAAEFPFAADDAKCTYVRQGKIFNSHCNDSLFFPVCVVPFVQVSRSLVHESIPANPWIVTNAQTNNQGGGSVDSAPVASAFGLRRVSFEDNYFTCVNRPWLVDTDFSCGAAWDTAVFGAPQDVQMVSYNTLFVATKTSMYQVDLDLGDQFLVRQYNSFRRPMMLVQKWNLTVVFGATRTDFFTLLGGSKRVAMASLRYDDSCDSVEFVTVNTSSSPVAASRYFLCITSSVITKYSYTINSVTLTFAVLYASKTVVVGKQFSYQMHPVKFGTFDDSGAETADFKGTLRMTIFDGLVSQNVASNKSLQCGAGCAEARMLCNLLGRSSPAANVSSAGKTKRAYTSLTLRLPNADEQDCQFGRWGNCVHNQLPLSRTATLLDCSSGTNSANVSSVTNSTLTWTERLLSLPHVGPQNGQVPLKFSEGAPKPAGAPTQGFQVTATSVTNGVVVLAFIVTNFPCLTRASDFSSYCMSTIKRCDPTMPGTGPTTTTTCFDTFSYGPVTFGEGCDVIRYCNATVISSFSAAEPSDPATILSQLVANAKTFAGGLDTLLQFNVTGEEHTRVVVLGNRVAAFQSVGNASLVNLDQSTDWLKTQDSPLRSFNLLHPTVATRSLSATAAILTTDKQSLFWKRSTRIVTTPGADPYYYTVIVYSENADEHDNVLYCGDSLVTGLVLLAPDRGRPHNETVPPLAVTGVPPGALFNGRPAVYSGFWQQQQQQAGDVSLGLGSSFNATTGEFTVSVNCTTTRTVSLFLNFSDGATLAIPFFVVGKQLGKQSAGAPPAVEQYPPLPADSAIPVITTSSFSGSLSGLLTATTIADVSAIFAAQSGSAVPAIDLSVYLPIGSFVLSDSCPPQLGTVTTVTTNDSNNMNTVRITLAVKSGLLDLVHQCIAFSPSPAASVRMPNLMSDTTSRRMAAQISYGGQVGTVALILGTAVQKNPGPLVVGSVCNTTITVDHEEIAYLGQVFRSPTGRNLEISAAIVYRGASTSPNQNIRVECNSTGFCWVFYDVVAQTANMELTASDGYLFTSTTCGVYAEFVSLRRFIEPPVFQVHAGASFQMSIPASLFISSAAYTITGISEGPFPVESSLAFQSPSSVVGSLNTVKLYNISVYASNIYGTATASILFNVTNYAPRAAANATFSLRALVPFDLTVSLSALIVELDADAVRFAILSAGLLPQWLTTAITPDTLSTTPQQLLLKGTATADMGLTGGDTVVAVQVADLWSSTRIFIILSFARESISVNPGADMTRSFYTHPGSFTIPFNLSYYFSASQPWNFFVTGKVTSDIAFAAPLEILLPSSGSSPSQQMAFITGTLSGSNALTPRLVTVQITSPFGTVSAQIAVRGTNQAPTLTVAATSVTRPIVLGTFFAKHKILLSIPVSSYFSDPDGDPVQFRVGAMSGNTWLSSAVTFAPGQLSTAAQTMTIDGEVSALAANSNATLPIVCSDTWGETLLDFVVIIPAVQPPVLLKPFQNVTISPGSSETLTILLEDHFVSPTGDALTGKVQVLAGSGWITATLTGNAGAETLKLTLAPVTEENYQGTVLVSTSNEFGMAISSSIVIQVVMTPWQQAQSYVTLASTIVGAVLSLWGIVAYWPQAIAIWKGRSILKECPLTRENCIYHFPEETEEVKVFVRDADKWCSCLFSINHFFYNWWTLRPPARAGPPTYIKILDKSMKLRLDLEYDLQDPPDDCVIQIYKGDGIVMEEFTVEFKKCMGFDGPDADTLNKLHVREAASPVSGSPGASGGLMIPAAAEYAPRHHTHSGANSNNNNSNQHHHQESNLMVPLLQMPQVDHEHHHHHHYQQQHEMQPIIAGAAAAATTSNYAHADFSPRAADAPVMKAISVPSADPPADLFVQRAFAVRNPDVDEDL